MSSPSDHGADDLVRLVREMRVAQQRYFKERSQPALVASKRLEKEVDKWLEDWTAFGLSFE